MTKIHCHPQQLHYLFYNTEQKDNFLKHIHGNSTSTYADNFIGEYKYNVTGRHWVPEVDIAT